VTPTAVSPDPDAVTSEIEIAAPPDRVFRALTDPRQLFAWWGAEPSVELLEFEMDARPGGAWRFRCRPVPGSDHGAVGKQLQQHGASEFEAHGEVLQCVPPQLLVWSWVANWHAHPDQATVVRWELTRTPSGTRVRVTHGGLAQERVARTDYSSGWVGVLKLLHTHLSAPGPSR
jgi:uncharacterized protein YndB with AHSA1/START domain